MPKDEPNPNGRKPRDQSHFDRTPLMCKRCKQISEHFIIEEIDDLTQLRDSNWLVVRTEMKCLACGWTFSWDINSKKLEEMSITYGAIVKRLYSAE